MRTPDGAGRNYASPTKSSPPRFRRGRIHAPRLRIGDDAARTTYGTETRVTPNDGADNHRGLSLWNRQNPASRRGTQPCVPFGRLAGLLVGLGLGLAAGLLLAPGEARAEVECGFGNRRVLNCPVMDFSNGIVYGIAGSGNSWSGPSGQQLNLLGSATRPITITAGALGVGIGGRTTATGGFTINAGGATDGTPHVINIVQGTNSVSGIDRNNGIYVWQESNNSGVRVRVNVRAGVTIGTMATPMKQHGIFIRARSTATSQGRGAPGATIDNAATVYAAMQGLRISRTQGGTNDNTVITNSGAIFSGVGNPSATSANYDQYRDNLPHGILGFIGGTQLTGSLVVTNSGDITLGGPYVGILMQNWGAGAMSLDNRGDIRAAAGQTVRRGIQFDFEYWDNQSARDVTLTNSGAITASDFGIRLKKLSGGDVELTNSGDITVTGDAAQHLGHAIYLADNLAVDAGRTYAANSGDVTVDNGGALRSKNHALYVIRPAAAYNGDDLELTNSGDVASEEGDGIRLDWDAQGDVSVENSGSVSGKGHGIYVGQAARIDFDQSGSGTIRGRTGVYLGVTRFLTTGGTRSTDSGGDHIPAIDVTWSGGSVARGPATTGARFTATTWLETSVADREATVVKSVEDSLRWGAAAGLEARVLSWRAVMEQVAAGDDPGVIANAAAQTTLLATSGAGSRRATILAQVRAMLGNDDLSVGTDLLTAIDSTATSVSDLSDAEIATYLTQDAPDIRIILRNILRYGLSAAEKAVLAAVVAGDGTALTTALAVTTPAAFSSAYKTAVTGLLSRYNLDDVSVSMTGGEIASRGDGIRAYYATANDSNGSVEITIGANAAVEGDVHGIHVSGGGVNASSVKQQRVTVNGRVTGGTGAGVHLVGGGTVTVGAGGRVGATSGTAIETSDGGDLTAAISGRVEGDIRAAGTLTLTSAAGSVITGTVHDPSGSLSVAGSIGRIVYTSGGTVTVAAAGRLTGVSGEAVRSDSGDLSVTIAGRATGDVEAGGSGNLTLSLTGSGRLDGDAEAGGTLTLTAAAGTVITGTVHDPSSAFTTVSGSIGRIVYTSGGTVTVAAAGRLTGASGEAVRSDAGNLSVTIAGRATGDVEAGGSGNLTLSLTGSGRLDGDAEAGGTLTLTAAAGTVITGTVHDPSSAFSTVSGSIGRILYTNGGTVAVAAAGALTGVSGEAVRSDAGNLNVDVSGRAGGDVIANGGGDLDLDVLGSGRVEGDVKTSGGGDLDVSLAGTGRIDGDVRAQGGGDLTLASAANTVITGTAYDPTGALSVAGSVGRILYTNGGDVTVASGGALTGIDGVAVRSAAGNLDADVAGRAGGDVIANGGGDLDVDVSGTVAGDVLANGGGDLTADLTGTGRVEGDIRASGGGTLTLTAAAGTVITGTVYSPASPFTVSGSIGRIVYTNGGTATVAAAGALTGVSGEAVRSEAGDLSVTVAGRAGGAILANGGGDLTTDVSGTVEGDVIASGGGDVEVDVTAAGRIEGDVRAEGGGMLTLTAAAGSVITGTVYGRPAGAFTVEGSIGRLVYASGGEVTVAEGGVLTGVDTGDGMEVIRSEAGDLSVTVAGRIGGGIRSAGGLDVTITSAAPGDLRAGGDMTADISGTVEGDLDAGGDLTATITGEVEGDLAAGGDMTAEISGTVEGSVRAGGAVTAELSGRIEGDLDAGGALALTATSGSVIAGTLRGPGGAFTVRGSIGRILYRGAGTVTVPEGGVLTGVDTGDGMEVIRGEAGDLSVVVAGTVGGGIRSAGGLDVTITSMVPGDVRAGGDVTADVSGTLTGDLDAGGDMTADITGTLTGDVVAGGDLTADISGTVDGSVRSGGDLTAVITGMVTGDVEGPGAGDHTVTVSAGAVVTGTVHLAASTVRVDGTVGGVRFRRGGTLTIGPNGRILAGEGVAIRNDRGALTVTIEAAPGERPEESVARVEGTVVDPGGNERARTLTLLSTDGQTAELSLDLEGRIRSGLPPRAKVYEALPSVLLGMSRPLSYGERLSAPRSPRGAWARVEGASASWKAVSSASDAEYDMKRHGVRAGVDLRAGADFLLGFSVHHVRGSANMGADDEGGELEARGSGLGLHAAWAFGGGFYAAGQFEATSYEADMESDRRGELETGARALGLTVGAELGRRVASGGVTIAPRVRLVHASVSMDDFTDEAGSEVSVKDAASFTGAAGVSVEKRTRAGRAFVSADFEREFIEETRVKLDRDALKAKASESRLRLRAGGLHAWGGGRYAVRGALDFSAAGDESYEVGGSLAFRVRF